jgi:serine/threonine-protein kinase PknG
MRTCPHPGCFSAVDETGYCEERGHPAQPPDQPRPASPGLPALGSERRWWSESPRTWTVAGLVPLPTLNLPSPATRITDASRLPPMSRICNGCAAVVGGSYADQPSLSEGYCGQCATAFSFAPRLSPGEQVGGRYEVVGPIGRGGLGWVYLGEDLHLDRSYVVLKGLIDSDDPVQIDLAARERQTLQTLEHPNVMRIFDAVTHRERQSGRLAGYTVMEYVNGPTLDEVRQAVLRGATPLPLERVLAYGHEILAALGYLHREGWLYCDLKPDNVMHGPTSVKIIDLNGVRRQDDRASPYVGHEDYQVPREELRRRGHSVQSDLYTVGKTLDRLFEASADRYGPAPVTIAVRSFERLVKRATDPDPDARFASAAAMSIQLVGVLCEAIALREPVERTEQSTVFRASAELVDGDLSMVPSLARWVRDGLDVPVTVAQPPPGAVLAIGLPAPIPAAEDPAAGMLAQIGAPDPSSLLAQLQLQGLESVEVWLRRSRAYLERDDSEQAMYCVDRAEELGLPAGARWRLAWHRGLARALRGTYDSATAAFEEVYAAVPGEIAPKLALGLCLERIKPSACEPYLTAAWCRDRGQVSAAFALARRRLAGGDRHGAVAVLDEVPPISRHFTAARVGAVRALCEPLPSGAPEPAQVRLAARRLVELRQLDGGDQRGPARERLGALVQQAALRLSLDGIPFPDERSDTVLGTRVTENGLRQRLEVSLRRLARQAGAPEEFAALVDLANRVRPRTLITPWG